MNDRGRPEAAHGAAAEQHTARPGLDPFGDFTQALSRYPASFRCLADAHGSDDDSGPSDEPPSQRRLTPAEIAAERLQALEAFVEKYGIDWWDHHDAPPEGTPGTQLHLVESEAA